MSPLLLLMPIAAAVALFFVLRHYGRIAESSYPASTWEVMPRFCRFLTAFSLALYTGGVLAVLLYVTSK